MNVYIGTDSAGDTPWFGTGPLRKNILRQRGIHFADSSWSPYWTYAYFYCDESKLPKKGGESRELECSSPNNPGKSVTAYTFPDDGHWYGWNAKYVVFCPRFFLVSWSCAIGPTWIEFECQLVLDISRLGLIDLIQSIMYCTWANEQQCMSCWELLGHPPIWFAPPPNFIWKRCTSSLYPWATLQSPYQQNLAVTANYKYWRTRRRL